MRGLEVDQNPPAVVGAQRDQAGEQGRGVAGLVAAEPPERGERQPPDLAVADRGPRRRSVQIRRSHPQVQVLVAEVRRQQRRRSPAVLPLCAGESAQPTIEKLRGRFVRPGPQGGFGQRRLSAGSGQPAAEGPVPQLFAAAPAQGGEEPGGQQRGRGQLVRVGEVGGVQQPAAEPSRRPGAGVTRLARAAGLRRVDGPGSTGRAPHERAAPRGLRRGGRGGCAPWRAVSVRRRVLRGRAVRGRRRRPQPGQIQPGRSSRDRSSRDRSSRGRSSWGGRAVPRGNGLQARAVGVPGQVQHPARPDQAGDREPGAVRLDVIFVQLEDLLVPAAIPQILLRDLPQALVEPPDGRLHDVDLPGLRRVASLGCTGQFCLAGVKAGCGADRRAIRRAGRGPGRRSVGCRGRAGGRDRVRSGRMRCCRRLVGQRG